MTCLHVCDCGWRVRIAVYTKRCIPYYYYYACAARSGPGSVMTQNNMEKTNNNSRIE